MDTTKTLPIPTLSSPEIINLGPVIDPPFSDARDWSEQLTAIELLPVECEELEPRLTQGDSERLSALALSMERVIGALEGKRHMVMGVGMRSLDRETEYPLVVIYNYTDDTVIDALVDPVREELVGMTVEHYQPPLASSELDQAREIVRKHGRLTKAGVDVETGTGIVVEEENFRDHRHRHRLVDLRFGPPDRRIPTAWAIVDLSAQDVVRTGIYPVEELS